MRSFSGRRLAIDSNSSVGTVGQDGGDDALQCADAGQHHLQACQLFFSQDQQLSSGAAFHGTAAQPFSQVVFGGLVEAAQSQIAANTLCLHTLGRFAAGPVEKEHRRQFELT